MYLPLDPYIGLPVRGFVVAVFVDIAFSRRRNDFDARRRRGHANLHIDDAGARDRPRHRQKGDYVLRNLFAMSDKSPDRSIRNRQRRAAQ